MKLIELIESGVNHDDILYHDGWALGMRKCKDLGDVLYIATRKLENLSKSI